jgi:PPP family 3-phenylpropionic acid transporter
VTPRQPAAAAEGLALGAAYAANFGALASSAPFLALYLASAGFGAEATAQVLAIGLLLRVVAVPAWTLLADRLRASAVVLRVATVGALLALGALALLASPPKAIVVLLLLLFALCRAPFGPLLDAIMLHRARAAGHAFGGVRAWGTAGYAAAALITGSLVARSGTRAVLHVSIVILIAALAAAARLGRGDTAGDAPTGTARMGKLLQVWTRPRMLLLLAVALLQQPGLAAYDALFPAQLTKLAGATAAGVAVALGAASEFAFLLLGPRLARRFGPERVLALACATSVLRWSAMAVLTNPILVIACQMLHALSFGAFYMASVIIVDRETPPELRASAQGAFGSLTFGVGAAAGLSIAGILEPLGGARAVFGFAACSALLGTLACAGLVAGVGRGGEELGHPER